MACPQAERKRNVKNEGKKTMLKVSLIDRTSWFSRLERRKFPLRKKFYFPKLE